MGNFAKRTQNIASVIGNDREYQISMKRDTRPQHYWVPIRDEYDIFRQSN